MNLFFVVIGDTQDWRSHYEQMHQYNSGIDSTLSQTKVSSIVNKWLRFVSRLVNEVTEV